MDILERFTLTQKIILPISISLLFIFTVGVVAFQYQYKTGLGNLAFERISNIDGQLHEEIQHKTKILKGVINLFTQDPRIAEYLKTKDRDALYAISVNTFARLHKDLNITHLYFTDSNLVNILRVHESQKYGDVINRVTSLEAKQTGKVTSGIELGPMGTITLRVVSPVFQDHQLLGFVEMGIDAKSILKEIAVLMGANMLLAIPKQSLNQTLLQYFQKFANWNSYSNMIVPGEYKFFTFPDSQIPPFSAISQTTSKLGFIENEGNKTVSWHKIDLENNPDKNAAELFITEFQKTTITTFSTVAVISLILLFSIFKLTRRAEKAESSLQKAKDVFEELATMDQLTLLPNRECFLHEVAHRIHEAERFNYQLAICFIDLDNFKYVNDALGHAYGDQLIKCAADRMSHLIRDYDILSRFGGDEFVLMLPHINSESDVAGIINKLVLEMKKPFILEKEVVHVSISAGISIYPDDAKTIDELMRLADVAMYEVKDTGKSNYRFFTKNINNSL